MRDNLYLYGRYFGLPKRQLRERVDELLEFARLTDRADERVDPLSGGMRRRLTIARALVSSPSLVILDEPTTGLDPQARHLLWDRLYRLKREGVTLVVTTHYMDEAEQLCDRLVVMDAGRIAAGGSPRELIERWSTREVVELRFEPEGHEVHGERLADLAERVEVLPDRLVALHRRGRCDAGRGDGPRGVPDRGPREALDSRGRLLAPDRAEPRRLTVDAASPPVVGTGPRGGPTATCAGHAAGAARLPVQPARLQANLEGVAHHDLPVPGALPRRHGRRASAT